MDEGGKDVQSPFVAKEIANEELAKKLEVLAEHDPEKYIHNPVYFLTHDKQSDQPEKTKVGDIFDVGEDDAFIFVINEQQKRRIFVVTPAEAPGAAEEQEVQNFYKLIGYNREESRFGEDFGYSNGTLTYADSESGKTFTHSNLADYFEDRGMLLAKSETHAVGTINNKLTAAFEHGKQRVGLPEGAW